MLVGLAILTIVRASRRTGGRAGSADGRFGETGLQRRAGIRAHIHIHAAAVVELPDSLPSTIIGSRPAGVEILFGGGVSSARALDTGEGSPSRRRGRRAHVARHDGVAAVVGLPITRPRPCGDAVGDRRRQRFPASRKEGRSFTAVDEPADEPRRRHARPARSSALHLPGRSCTQPSPRASCARRPTRSENHQNPLEAAFGNGAAGRSSRRPPDAADMETGSHDHRICVNAFAPISTASSINSRRTQRRKLHRVRAS